MGSTKSRSLTNIIHARNFEGKTEFKSNPESENSLMTSKRKNLFYHEIEAYKFKKLGFGKKDRKYVVCKYYSPAGNMMGAFETNILPI